MANEGVANVEGQSAGASTSTGAVNAGDSTDSTQGGQQGQVGQIDRPADRQSLTGAQPGNQSGEHDSRYRGLTADLQKERRTRQQHERDLAQARAELETVKRQVAALTNVQAPTSDEQEAEQIRAKFLDLFPQFKVLAGLSADELQGILQGVPAATNYAAQAEQREWQARGRHYLGIAGEQVAEALGVDKLTDQQVNIVRNHFAGWFKDRVESELQATGGDASETLTRYEQGDNTLVEEFVKHFQDQLLTPARRAQTATTVNRASQRVPNSTGRSGVTSSVSRPEKFKNDDERLDFMAKAVKEAGVVFGR